MNEFLNDLKTAFEFVGPENYRILALNASGALTYQEPENNFSGELLHRLRNIQETKPELYNGLYWHFDILKNRLGIKPDLVLHGGAENRDNQEIFVEVKTNSDSNLRDDINKLKLAISRELNYNNAVMMVINKNLLNTLKKINEYILLWNTEIDLSKLYLFHGRLNSQNRINFSYYKFNNLNDPLMLFVRSF